MDGGGDQKDNAEIFYGEMNDDALNRLHGSWNLSVSENDKCFELLGIQTSDFSEATQKLLKEVATIKQKLDLPDQYCSVLPNYADIILDRIKQERDEGYIRRDIVKQTNALESLSKLEVYLTRQLERCAKNKEAQTGGICTDLANAFADLEFTTVEKELNDLQSLTVEGQVFKLSEYKLILDMQKKFADLTEEIAIVQAKINKFGSLPLNLMEAKEVLSQEKRKYQKLNAELSKKILNQL